MAWLGWSRLAVRAVIISLLAVSLAQADGLKWDYISQFGGSGADVVAGIARDRAGNLYIAGNTLSYDFPANVLQTRPGGSNLYRIVNGGEQFAPLFALGPVRVSLLEADLRLPGTLYAWTARLVDGIPTERGLFKTTDWGEHWTEAGAGLPDGEGASALAIDPTDSNTLFAAFGTVVFKSTDAGLTWTRSSEVPGRNSWIYALAVDPNRPSIVLAGSYASLFRSEDGGVTWSEQPLASQKIIFDARRAGVVYAGGRDFIGKSSDSGATWKPMSLYGYSILSIALDVGHPGTIYVSAQGLGAVNSLFRSADDGDSWQRLTAPGEGSGAVNYYRQVNQLAFDSHASILYAAMGDHVERSSGDFATWKTVGPAKTNSIQTLTLAPDAADPRRPAVLFASALPANDVFVAKLDSRGKLVFATYFGGAGDDTAAGIAAGPDGSVFVTGIARSRDFPVTPGAYKTSSPDGGAFVFKLGPEGKVVYCTLLADAGTPGASSGTSPTAIAVDNLGAAYVTGTTFGGIAITAGVIQPEYRGFQCGLGSILCFPRPDNFVMKLDAAGSDLEYSSYFSPAGGRIAVDAGGNTYVSRGRVISKLNRSASQLIYEVASPGQVEALTLNERGELFAGGSVYTSPPLLPPGTLNPSDTPHDVFVGKLPADGSVFLFTRFMFTRVIGGRNLDSARGIAVDREGNVTIVGFSSSTDFPTRSPLQGPFNRSTGFVAKLAPDGSGPIYSTFAGDERAFDMRGVVLDDEDNPIFAGNNLGLRPAAFPATFAASQESDIFVVRLDTHQPEPTIRLDAVLNRASMLANPVAPGEWLILTGSGFTGENLQVLVDGASAPVLYVRPTLLVAVAPEDVDSHDAPSFQVVSGDRQSNVVLMPSAPYSPAIYTFDQSGRGQGMIFNEDDTANSPTNPAAVGSVVEIVTEGLGRAAVDPTGVGETPVSVFIDGFRAEVLKSSIVEGLVRIKARVPDPKLLPLPSDFNLPPIVAVTLEIGGTPGFACAGTCSQSGVSIAVRQ